MAYAVRDRRWLLPFSVLTALTVYAHNWGLFLGVGMGVAFLVLWRTAPEGERAPLLRDGLHRLRVGGGACTCRGCRRCSSRPQHTGAPWSAKPPLDGLISGMQNLVGGVETALLLTVVAAGRADHAARWGRGARALAQRRRAGRDAGRRGGAGVAGLAGLAGLGDALLLGLRRAGAAAGRRGHRALRQGRPGRAGDRAGAVVRLPRAVDTRARATPTASRARCRRTG